jgi:hypothetical protein
VLLNAIGEWNQLQRVKVAVRNKLLEIMQLAREHQVPRSDYLRTNFSLLCRLAENYDHLLWLITDRKQIQQWIMQTRAEIEEAERIARQPVRPLSGRENGRHSFSATILSFGSRIILPQYWPFPSSLSGSALDSLEKMTTTDVKSEVKPK